jgi:hypothetical protein
VRSLLLVLPPLRRIHPRTPSSPAPSLAPSHSTPHPLHTPEIHALERAEKRVCIKVQLGQIWLRHSDDLEGRLGWLFLCAISALLLRCVRCSRSKVVQSIILRFEILYSSEKVTNTHTHKKKTNNSVSTAAIKQAKKTTNDYRRCEQLLAEIRVLLQKLLLVRKSTQCLVLLRQRQLQQ